MSFGEVVFIPDPGDVRKPPAAVQDTVDGEVEAAGQHGFYVLHDGANNATMSQSFANALVTTGAVTLHRREVPIRAALADMSTVTMWR